MQAALDSAHAAFGDLMAIGVDVTGIDLRALKLPGLNMLAGFLWSSATIWPEDLHSLVQEQSAKVGHDLYVVRRIDLSL